MKRLTSLLLSSSFVVLLVSCGAKEARDFSDKMVGIQKELLAKVNAEKDEPGDGAAKLQKMRSTIVDEINQVKALKTPTDGDGFKNAMLDDFNGVLSSYDILIKMSDPAIQDDDKTKLQGELADWETKITTLDQNVVDEQKKFAEKKGFKIQ